MSVIPDDEGAITPPSKDISLSLISSGGVWKALAGSIGIVPRSRAAWVSRMPIAYRTLRRSSSSKAVKLLVSSSPRRNAIATLTATATKVQVVALFRHVLRPICHHYVSV